MDENLVEIEQQESVQADTEQASTAEQEQNGIVALSELLDRAVEDSEGKPEESQDTDTHQEAPQESKVSGGIKGRLLAENKKGYEAGRAAAMKEWQEKEAQYQERLQRLDAIELREKATKIAKEQNVSEEVAMFLAKNGFESSSDNDKNGQTDKPASVQTARDEHGRFVKQEANNEHEDSTMERAKVLSAQAENIKKIMDIDAIDLYKHVDAETQAMIARGEMDLFDLVQEYKNETGGNSAKRTPPNIRSNASRTNSGIRFGNLSDSDIDRMNEYFRKGGVVNGEM